MEEAFLLRVIDSIKNHLVDDEFSVDILAREVGMSRSQLHRKLIALTELSATEFIRTYRQALSPIYEVTSANPIRKIRCKPERV